MIDSSYGLIHAVIPLKEQWSKPKIGVYKEWEICICFLISYRESDLQSLQRRAVIKEIATGINRLSKLPGCSDVVITTWNGHNISEQVILYCSIVCAVYTQHFWNIIVSRFDKALCLLCLFMVVWIVL